MCLPKSRQRAVFPTDNKSFCDHSYCPLVAFKDNAALSGFYIDTQNLYPSYIQPMKMNMKGKKISRQFSKKLHRVEVEKQSQVTILCGFITTSDLFYIYAFMKTC